MRIIRAEFDAESMFDIDREMGEGLVVELDNLLKSITGEEIASGVSRENAIRGLTELRAFINSALIQGWRLFNNPD